MTARALECRSVVPIHIQKRLLSHLQKSRQTGVSRLPQNGSQTKAGGWERKPAFKCPGPPKSPQNRAHSDNRIGSGQNLPISDFDLGGRLATLKTEQKVANLYRIGKAVAGTAITNGRTVPDSWRGFNCNRFWTRSSQQRHSPLSLVTVGNCSQGIVIKQQNVKSETRGNHAQTARI